MVQQNSMSCSVTHSCTVVRRYSNYTSIIKNTSQCNSSQRKCCFSLHKKCRSSVSDRFTASCVPDSRQHNSSHVIPIYWMETAPWKIRIQSESLIPLLVAPRKRSESPVRSGYVKKWEWLTPTPLRTLCVRACETRRRSTTVRKEMRTGCMATRVRRKEEKDRTYEAAIRQKNIPSQKYQETLGASIMGILPKL